MSSLSKSLKIVHNRSQMRKLEGRVMIVTGASSGIGEALAVEAARAGMKVALAARRTDELERVADRVREAGGHALILPTDVADPAACQQLIDDTVMHWGSLDVLFANAGFGLFHHAEDSKNEEVENQMWRVNYHGAIHCIRAALKRMTASGHILVCSSIAGHTGLPWKATYAATKAALHGFATTLRMELEPHGIHVTTVYPVGTETAFSQTASRLSDEQSPRSKTPSWLVQTPEHVARRMVAAIKRPQAEVWPSRVSHLMAALWTLFPGLRSFSFRKHV